MQSFSDRDGASHHFEYTLINPSSLGTNPTMLRAAPQTGTGWDQYTFTTPLKELDKLTLIFRNPDVPINFLPDVLYDVTLDVDAAGELYVNAPGHSLNVGDRIYITRCATGHAALDNYVNRKDGNVAAGDPAAILGPGVPISVIGFPDIFYFDPSISISDVDSFWPGSIMPPQTVSVFVAKRRIRIPIRIRNIVPRVTNFITL